MVSLPLELALSVLTMACILMAVQLIVMTVEIVRLRRDVTLLLRTTSSINHSVNPWAENDEPTEPRSPRARPARWSLRYQDRWPWVSVRPPQKTKRQHPD